MSRKGQDHPPIRITETDRRRILEAAAEYGHDRLRIAAAAGLTEKQLDNATRGFRAEYRAALDSYDRRAAAERQIVGTRRGRNVADVLDLPVRPFEVPVLADAKATAARQVKRAVVYGDEHQPFADEQALSLVRAVIKDVQPEVVLHIGDGTDCYSISKYDTDPSRLWNLQDDIDAFRASLHRTADACPSARRVLLEGNHEDRLRRLIWGLPDKAKQLVRLRNVAREMEWPSLLDLDGVGFEWYDTEHQPVADVLPKMIAVHGTRLSPHAGYSARLELEKWGHSGISGHTHRMAVHPRRDYNGQARWIEAGFVGSYKQPYGQAFNWQQGMVVLEWSGDYRLMQEHLLFFRDGRVLWREKEFAA